MPSRNGRTGLASRRPRTIRDSVARRSRTSQTACAGNWRGVDEFHCEGRREILATRLVSIMARDNSAKTYLWCQNCRRSFSHADAPAGACPVCSAPMRDMSRFAAIARGFMANELTASDLETKHRQLIRLIWTRNGMGERYYRVLAPDMPYSRFEAKVTGLLPSPSADEAAYRLEFVDEERFVRELEDLVDPVTSDA